MNESEEYIFEQIRLGILIISDDGKVFSTRDWINYRSGYRHLDTPIRCEHKNSGYYEIVLKHEGRMYRAKSHRIVWMWFNGCEIPEGMQINHINGIRSDNRPKNIEVVTPAGNVNHAYATGLAHGRPGEKHHLVKITEVDVRKIKEMYSGGDISQDKIGKMYNLSQTQVGRIIRGERWQCVK